MAEALGVSREEFDRAVAGEKMARVEIKRESDSKTSIKFDGKEFVSDIISIDSHISAGHRDFDVKIHGVPDIDLDGRVDFSFSPQTVEEAVKVLRHALMTDKDLYSGLVASIESVLRESTVVWEEWEYTETARKIADRIAGIER